MAHKDRIPILYSNANGIGNKSIEFFNYLTDQKIQIAADCETFLKSYNRISHPDFFIYRLDKFSSKLGGLMLVLAKQLSHEQAHLPRFKKIAAVGITLKLHLRSLSIVSIYNPGGNTDSDSFRQDIRFICNIRGARDLRRF